MLMLQRLGHFERKLHQELVLPFAGLKLLE